MPAELSILDFYRLRTLRPRPLCGKEPLVLWHGRSEDEAKAIGNGFLTLGMN